MPARLYKRLLPALVLAGGLALAAIPALVSLYGLSDLRSNVESITRAADAAARARDVLNEISQSFVGFAMAGLEDLTVEERAQVLLDTDSYFGTTGRITEIIKEFDHLLSADQQHALKAAVAKIAHSWREFRYDSVGLTSAEKTFHFLNVFENVTIARDLLTAVEARAAADARAQTQEAFAGISSHVLWVVVDISFMVGLAAIALLLVLRAIGQARASNIELRTTNRELHKRKEEIQQGVEALQQAKEAAETASRAKSAFLAMVTHELRTPLNAIVGFSEMLAKESIGPLGNDQYREFAGLIHSSGRHLTTLINDILDFAKADAGNLELADDIIDIASIIGAAVSWSRPHAEQANLEVEVKVPDGLPDIQGDERRIKQILLNLMSNAVKFTPAGGHVTVGAECRLDGDLALYVRDTGIGIAPQNMNKALEPFAQIDTKLERKYEGAGLGLPLVKALVELHGGRLELASDVGTGTCVTAIFPASRLIAGTAERTKEHAMVTA